MAEQLIPIFRVQDGAKAAEWYARLGFEVKGEHRFAPGLPLYVFLQRGGVRLHLSEHEGDAKYPALAYLYVHDLDHVAEEFGVRIADQPWGREIKLSDPDGNRIRIGEDIG
ncbi:MAG: glyoxalase superfamily protein [Bacteroidota bacterium]